MRPGEDRIAPDILRVRQDHGHSRAHRPAPDDEWPFAGDQRAVPDPYTQDVRDRVPRARREPPNRDPQVAGARPATRRASRRAEDITSRHETDP